MTSKHRRLSLARVALAFACGAPAALSAQGREGYHTPYDALGLWQASVTGWRLPLASAVPPHHHSIFAQPASLELWGRPLRFGYYAGREVERPRGQRFAFGEAREDVVWIGETRQAFAQRVLSLHAESWSEERAPRRPEAPWATPLESEAARSEALERLGRAAWGERLRERGKPAAIQALARARGEHEILFALGALVVREAAAPATGRTDEELAGLLAMVGHSNHPHEALRAELDDTTRLGAAGSGLRLIGALVEGWSSLPADATPELDRERQASAQLDRAKESSLRRGARAAAARAFPTIVAGEAEARVFPPDFKLEHRANAGGGNTPIPGFGVALRFENGRVKLERGRCGPWSDEVAITSSAEGDSAFVISGSGTLQILFQAPSTVSSASLVVRHRLEAPAAATSVGILLTIDGNPVLDAGTTISRGARPEQQGFDLGELVRPKYPHSLMFSLAPGAPPEARYWLAAVELSIEE